MAEEELVVVRLHDDYYRDCFNKVVLIIGGISVSIALIFAMSLYFILTKPKPIVFRVEPDMRILKNVPPDIKYLSDADALQWVANIVPGLFNVDFMNYDDQVFAAKKYFTDNGYQIYVTQLNNYIDKANLLAGKQFASGTPTGAPFILSQQVIAGRYSWLVQIPINIRYAGMVGMSAVDLRLQVTVVRTDTLDNLMGILIDNIVVEKGKGDVVTGAG